MPKPATSTLSQTIKYLRAPSETRKMDATTTRQQRSYDAARATTSSNTGAINKTKVDWDKDKDTAPSSDPAALRARLKHRAPASGPTPTYDRVLDTARQLAELERLRAQDAAYIRLLEQGRATLVRDAHAGARERATASASATVTHEERQQLQLQCRKTDEAERAMKAERERAERGEMRVRALEEALSAARARVAELEGEVERERRRREEWESGLEQLAMAGPGTTGPSSAAIARL